MRTTVCESPLSANGPSQIPKHNGHYLDARNKSWTMGETWNHELTTLHRCADVNVKGTGMAAENLQDVSPPGATTCDGAVPSRTRDMHVLLTRRAATQRQAGWEGWSRDPRRSKPIAILRFKPFCWMCCGWWPRGLHRGANDQSISGKLLVAGGIIDSVGYVNQCKWMYSTTPCNLAMAANNCNSLGQADMVDNFNCKNSHSTLNWECWWLRVYSQLSSFRFICDGIDMKHGINEWMRRKSILHWIELDADKINPVILTETCLYQRGAALSNSHVEFS